MYDLSILLSLSLSLISIFFLFHHVFILSFYKIHISDVNPNVKTRVYSSCFFFLSISLFSFSLSISLFSFLYFYLSLFLSLFLSLSFSFSLLVTYHEQDLRNCQRYSSTLLAQNNKQPMNPRTHESIYLSTSIYCEIKK